VETSKPTGEINYAPESTFTAEANYWPLAIRLLFAYTLLDETLRERGRGAGLISVSALYVQRFACRTFR
jgi:hypothetical protein